MIYISPNPLTLKLRDAVRIYFWLSFNPELKQTNPLVAHAEFYSWWRKQPFISMDYSQIQEHLRFSGVSIEQALFLRQSYYGFLTNS